jgi:outer membrane protein assembly factor BamE (lipoprotein component of BamABCDE complex)
MKLVTNTAQGHGLVKHTILAIVGMLWIAGCATSTSELKQEIEVLLKQTVDEVRQETDRMDTEIAQLRSEVGQLRSDVGQVGANVGRMGSDMKQLSSEVSLIRTDVRKNDTSLVDLAVRVNQLDRRLGKNEQQPLQNGEQAANPSNAYGGSAGPQDTATAVSSPGAGAFSQEDLAKTLKQGMSQQEVRRKFGNPYGTERILDSVYWYYADGELRGQYVRFDAMTGTVNGWSTFSPQQFQIDLRTTKRGHTR